jgi:hypothetical protein
MARVMNGFWRLLVFFGLVAASLVLAEAKLGRGEPFCGQRGSTYWCAQTAADARSAGERARRGPDQRLLPFPF